MASSFLMYIEDEGGNDDDNFSYLENIFNKMWVVIISPSHP